ncbi:MAG: glycosyltransferase [Candidatus Staskawiczbacteria bacterium]|nr:glycosyltransferase [Candidatus Staskawiczbacteria bacterium]
MSQKPLVSVIIATHGERGKYLRKAIGSVLSQTYNNIEIIIVDDGSTDDTRKIVKPYLVFKNPKVCYIRQEKTKSPSGTRNNGIKISNGKYIAILDSDDCWPDSQKIEKQVAFLENNPEYVLAGGGVIRTDKAGLETRRFFLPEKDKDIRSLIILVNPFAHSAVLFRKSSWQEAGGYDKNFDFFEDWDLWLKFGKIGKFYNFQEYFTFYLEGGESQTDYNLRRGFKLSIKLRKKYRDCYPGKWKTFFLNTGYYVFVLFPFLVNIFAFFRNKMLPRNTINHEQEKN